jgi:hypothetical protein
MIAHQTPPSYFLSSAMPQMFAQQRQNTTVMVGFTYGLIGHHLILSTFRGVALDAGFKLLPKLLVIQQGLMALASTITIWSMVGASEGAFIWVWRNYCGQGHRIPAVWFDDSSYWNKELCAFSNEFCGFFDEFCGISGGSCVASVVLA